MTKPGRCLQRLLALAWLLAVLLVAGHNAWLWLGQRASPDTDILALLPGANGKDVVRQQAFSHMVDAAQQKLVVLVGDRDWSRARAGAQAYLDVLRGHAELIVPVSGDSAQWQSQWLDSLEASRTVLLSDTQRAELAVGNAQQWSQRALAGLYGAFGGPRLGAWQDDPFGLFSQWVQERAKETPVRPRDGQLFVERDGINYVLLLLELKAPALSMQAQEQVMPLLTQAQRAAHNQASEVVSGGVILHAAAASAQAGSESATIGAGSLLGILLLMWLTLRSFKPILYIALSIAVGCLGALSVSMLLFGKIHLLTLVFGASLIGIAQDYGIYFLCARLAAPASQDSQALLRRLLPGLALMLLAALIGYLGMALTPFPGLQQMAVFSALGLVFAWLTVICWFPQLIGPHTLRATPRALRFGQSIARWPDLLGGFAWHLVLPGAVALIGLAIVGVARLHSSDDIRALQKSPPALLQDQIRISQLLDMAAPVQFYLVRGASAEAVLQQEEALREKLQPLLQRKLISGVQALSNWVPSQRRQQENLSLLHRSLLDTRGDAPDAITLTARAIGESAQWAQALRQRMLEKTQPITPAQFLATPAAAASRHLWLGQVDGQFASIVALRGLADYRQLDQLAAVAEGLPGVQWVDKVGEISSVLRQYRIMMAWALLCAYAAIFALLTLRYRRRAWRALAPPLLASLLTLGLFGWLGQPLQLFHVLAGLLVLGLGVDYGIFLLESSPNQRAHAWLTVGLSAASALLSFGLLALSKSPPLHAFGLTMLCGMLLVWLLAPLFTHPGLDTLRAQPVKDSV
ncbi:MMPL family transporter [Herbaspirillum sp. C7C8]|uniref:MMPL family transporter n=1 Tax=Herbaspirillum sp. C7C8 TaxID=2736665 RepID=UPI001F522453|nr:MMPL family transporter [Herbaspirillum sp. C7C8]MCI1003459.1 MMPL family transporter [Herbaspirillum sp. C7C8]